MTLLHVDGFENYTTNAELNLVYQVQNSGVTVAQTGRFGVGYSVRIPLNRYIAYNLATPLTTVIVGFACYVTLINRDGRSILQLLNDGAAGLCTLTWFDGSPRVTFSSVTYVSSTIVTEGWHYFEIKFTAGSGTSGAFLMKIDGETVINVSGIATTSTGEAVSIVRLIGYDDVKFVGNLFDDWYVADTNGSVNNDIIGTPQKVRYYLPDANGDQNDWTASAGSNFQCVDDTAPFNTTDYVSTTGVGNKDNYSFASLSDFSTINGIAVKLIAMQTDVELKSIRAITKSGATEDSSSVQWTSNSYHNHEMIFETDPNTASAWTQTNVNNAYFGIKLES